MFVPSGRLRYALPIATALLISPLGSMVSLDHASPHRSSGPCKQLESEMALKIKNETEWEDSQGTGKHEKEVCLLHWLKSKMERARQIWEKREESGNGLPSHASPSEQSPCGAQ